MDVLEIDAQLRRGMTGGHDEERRDWSDVALDLRAGPAAVTTERTPELFLAGLAS
jgi:hypothetical protein